MHASGAWSTARGLAGIALVAALPACSAVSSGPPVHDLRLRAPDGVPLACEVAGSGEPALVFVHGWCCDRAFWRATLEAFAPTHRVASLDLAGHGASGAERASWTLDALADDVLALVSALGAERVILVGHSMGAPVALLAAARAGGVVRGVIGVESLHDADFTYPPGFLAQAAADLEADFPRALEASIRAALPPQTRPELVDWILARALRTDRRAAVELLRGLEGFDLPRVLSGAGVPVRVINAAPRAPGGLVTDVEGNKKLADFAAELMEGVGHFPMLEQPARFQALLRRSLDSLEAAAR